MDDEKTLLDEDIEDIEEDEENNYGDEDEDDIYKKIRQDKRYQQKLNPAYSDEEVPEDPDTMPCSVCLQDPCICDEIAKYKKEYKNEDEQQDI